jgi:protein tyrosine/serine phosphatase
MNFILISFVFFCFSQVFAEGTQPRNFFQVDPLISRGAAITRDNVHWLAEHGTKTIVKLDDENPDEFTWEIPVKYFHINKFGFNLTFSLVEKILDSIEESAKSGSVYVHCEKGADRTGLIIALFRVKNGWSLEDARSEMNDPKFGHSALQFWMDYKFDSYAKRLIQKRK